MHKKATSAPMMEMLNRMTSFKSDGLLEFKTVFFEESMILHQPVEEWPLCEGARHTEEHNPHLHHLPSILIAVPGSTFAIILRATLSMRPKAMTDRVTLGLWCLHVS